MSAISTCNTKGKTAVPNSYIKFTPNLQASIKMKRINVLCNPEVKICGHSGELRHGTCHFCTRYTGTYLYNVNRNLNLCIIMWSSKLFERYHDHQHLWVWLSITTNINYANMSSNAEQKMMVACYQTCYTNSTEGTIHGSIWKNQQLPTVFLHDDAYATEAPPPRSGRPVEISTCIILIPPI